MTTEEPMLEANELVEQDADALRNPTPDELDWLIRQLAKWPDRVDEEKTTNISFLMKSAALALSRTPPVDQDEVERLCAKLRENADCSEHACKGDDFNEAFAAATWELDRKAADMIERLGSGAGDVREALEDVLPFLRGLEKYGEDAIWRPAARHRQNIEAALSTDTQHPHAASA